MKRITVKEIQDALKECARHDIVFNDSCKGLPDVSFHKTLVKIISMTKRYYVYAMENSIECLVNKLKNAQQKHITAFLSDSEVERCYTDVCSYNRLIKELPDKMTKMFTESDTALGPGEKSPFFGVQVRRALKAYQDYSEDHYTFRIEWQAAITFICTAARYVLFGLLKKQTLEEKSIVVNKTVEEAIDRLERWALTLSFDARNELQFNYDLFTVLYDGIYTYFNIYRKMKENLPEQEYNQCEGYENYHSYVDEFIDDDGYEVLAIDSDEGYTEIRYNKHTDRYESYPDWLGGDESEEEFWEHE